MRERLTARPSSPGRVAVALGLLVLALASSGCSATSGDGTMSGTIVAVGGPAPGTSRTLTEGTVTISGDHASKSLDVDENGQFSVQLPSGDYEVTGTSPQASGLACRADGGVHVSSGNTTNVEVVCSIK